MPKSYGSRKMHQLNARCSDYTMRQATEIMDSQGLASLSETVIKAIERWHRDLEPFKAKGPDRQSNS